ncbi:MAG: hypothetical protein NZ772_03185 [Cyanobacteria bacterium]|nr:hypothetical protein [Cyanobacteriota bacterium]MDW8200024.1 hypothetical protein [Cyanobacteriota bacterium SKYGB_h_bin112]
MSTVLGSLSFNATAIASVGLWSLALYLGFSPIGAWLEHSLLCWLAGVDRHSTPSIDDPYTQGSSGSQVAIYANLLAMLPFLLGGLLCSFGVELSLGQSWALSLGILAAVSCGIYELGRRDGQANQ